MKKAITLFCATLVALSVFGQITVETIWQKTDYTWNTGNHCRDMAYANAKMYVIDKNTKAIQVINSSTGAVELPLLTGHASITGYSIAADSNGDLMATEGAYGMTGCFKATKCINNVATYLGSTDIAAMGGKRFDYISIYGSLSGDGLLVSPSSNDDRVAVWPIIDGAMTISTPFVYTAVGIGTASGADVTIVNSSNFWLSGQSKKPILITLNEDMTVNPTASTLNIPATTVGGLATFSLYEKTFIVVPTTALGKINFYDITDMENPVLEASVTTDLGAVANGTNHIALEVSIENDAAYIYQWVPNNGAAVYKFKDPTIGLENQASSSFQVFTAKNQININGQVGANVSVFDFSGRMLVNQLMNGSSASYTMNQGMYIVKVNAQTFKVAVQ